MEDRDHDTEPEGGVFASGPMGRRDALKRAAIVGGTAVWAVPLVQVVGTRVAGAVSAPPPPPPPPPPPKEECLEIDYCCLVFKKHGTKYKAKWDDGWKSTSGDPSGCSAPSGWSSATGFFLPWLIGVDKDYDDGKLCKITFELPHGFEFYNGGCGRAKEGSASQCLVGNVHSNNRKCTFTAPVV